MLLRLHPSMVVLSVSWIRAVRNSPIWPIVRQIVFFSSQSAFGTEMILFFSLFLFPVIFIILPRSRIIPISALYFPGIWPRAVE